MRYDGLYSETIRLFDGTRAHLRLVRPEDAPLLQAGFAALSPETRYLRFFAHKGHLSEEEARRLTDLDGQDNLAIGAVGDAGTIIEGMPMGVARYARCSPSVVEAAIVVVDAFQGRGLGRALLVRLAEAARERGITALTFTALAQNRAVRRLVEKAFPTVVIGPMEEGTITYCAILDAEETSSREPGAQEAPPKSLVRRLRPRR